MDKTLEQTHKNRLSIIAFVYVISFRVRNANQNPPLEDIVLTYQLHYPLLRDLATAVEFVRVVWTTINKLERNTPDANEAKTFIEEIRPSNEASKPKASASAA